MSLDSTIAGAAAESYLSVAEADALAHADYGPEADWWLDGGLEQKELALRRATAEVDEYVRTGWARYSATQALLFPRLIDISAPAVPLIPARIARATYYQAAFLVKGARVLAAADMRRARGLRQASEPNLSYSVGDDPQVLTGRALHALEGYRRAGGAKAVRSVRMVSGSGYAT